MALNRLIARTLENNEFIACHVRERCRRFLRNFACEQIIFNNFIACARIAGAKGFLGILVCAKVISSAADAKETN